MPDLMPPVSVRPVTWVTSAPAREDVRIAVPEESLTNALAAPGAPASSPAPGWPADVYVPRGRGPFPAIIVSLGINQAARDDPRVRKVGDGLSRLGFVVLIPANDDLRAERLTSDAVAMLVAAFDQLAARPDVDPARIGFFGVCVGASLALLAAQAPDIADRVAWVAWFGGYYRLDTLIAAVASRSLAAVPDRDCPPGEDCAVAGTPRPWDIDPLSERVIRRHLLDLVDDPAERAAVARAAGIDPATGERTAAPETLPLVPGTTRQHGVALLLGSAVTFDEALNVLASLPAAAQALMADLSPATELEQLRAPLYTMNDVGDPLIPHTETDALNRDAAELGRLTRARTFDVFRHVDLDPFADTGRTLPEIWRLYRHVHAIVGTGLLD